MSYNGTARMMRIANDYRAKLGDDACWPWAVLHPLTGYGKCGIKLPCGKTTWTAHRAMYAHLVGPVQHGMVLDHICKNRACVNPRHLDVVTQRENLMRSPTLQAKNAAKTHCVKGHEFSPQNTFTAHSRTGPKRVCRECQRGFSKKYYHAKKAAA